MIKRSLVDVLRVAPKRGAVDELQLAIQPLLFVLARSKGQPAARALADMTWYRLGEANNEVLECILTRRDDAFRMLRSKAVDDCAKQLGNGFSMCLSRQERSVLIEAVVQRRRTHASCDLQY